VVDYDYELIRNEISREKLGKRPVGVWKYIELLPISDWSNIISLGEGGTYLHTASRIAERIGLKRLFIKDETTNPTGSFVDRGVTIELSRARQLGYTSTVCGTAGNLGASLAAYSAKAGFKCKIFLPKKIDIGKFYQIIAYGAEIEPTRDYEEAVSRAATLGRDSYLVFPGDPFFLEGLKTTGYEICEQFGWKQPRNIIVPMGDGGHISMIWRGIDELSRVGLVDGTKPRMIGVQAHGAAPIVKAFQNKRIVVKQLEKTDTLAMDIGVKRPLHGNLAIQAISQSGGRAIAVPDKEMLNAASLLAKTEGIFAEPASASTVASLLRLVEDGDIDRDEEIVCVLTGTGLKDPSSTRKFIEGRKRIERLLERIGERTVTTGLTGTKLNILKVLSENRSYGYELRKKLRGQFDLDLSLPSIYQHINELERMELVEKVHITRRLGKRERQYYALTEKGRVVLKGSVTTR
jgi:threonine synthase